ncbi:hypothetical protein ABE65_011685 [Fictibacillus phosphorivorans]|uniref:Uncharacterized protein n=1 Tax=Fictibacillus phosphorivorans TaxID=1221500 RepID=A0A160IN15_9BACL|nr:DUF6678 family protein [Fictibacillus phosphorivorans]ANC77427.1 hypothetical protein ABE65_011685 [Fictibacillus phosphorivorans]
MQNKDYQCVMNNTKWHEIRLAMSSFPTSLQWRTKDIETAYISTWDSEWFYHFMIEGYKCIEWLEIKTETEIIKNEVLEILKSIHVPGKIFEDKIRVYGYVEVCTSVDYL